MKRILLVLLFVCVCLPGFGQVLDLGDGYILASAPKTLAWVRPTNAQQLASGAIGYPTIVEVIDEGNNFAGATYTAPLDGVYVVTGTLSFYSGGAPSSTSFMDVVFGIKASSRANGDVLFRRHLTGDKISLGHVYPFSYRIRMTKGDTLVFYSSVSSTLGVFWESTTTYGYFIIDKE